MELVGDGVDFFGKHGAELDGMPMHSHLFVLMNDQNCFGFVLDFLQCAYLGSLSRIWLQLCWFVFGVA